MTTVTMATTPDRLIHALGVVEDLRSQCDRMQVYVNGHAPMGLRSDVVWYSAPVGDVADMGKWFDAPLDGYHLTVDDDLHYPPGYVRDMVTACNGFDDRAVVSLHGCDVRPPIRSYYRDRVSKSRCLYQARADVRVMVPGTGALCYRAGQFYPPTDLERFRYMSDIAVGVAAQEQCVPCWAVAHEAGYVAHRDIDHSQTIWNRFFRADAPMTAEINAITWA